MRYKRRPFTVEALRLEDGLIPAEALRWVENALRARHIEGFEVRTGLGDASIELRRRPFNTRILSGDWILKHADGNLEGATDAYFQKNFGPHVLPGPKPGSLDKEVMRERGRKGGMKTKTLPGVMSRVGKIGAKASNKKRWGTR
jgi:hypothetical protein